MSVPDKLVEAAAEALFEKMRYAPIPVRGQASDFDRHVARTALTAAFAALPGCEEAVDALVDRWREIDGTWDPSWPTVARKSLAALAEMGEA